MPFTNEGGVEDNVFDWTVYDGDTAIGTFTFTTSEFSAELIDSLDNIGTSLTLSRSALVATLQDVLSNGYASIDMGATGLVVNYEPNTHTTPHPTGTLAVSTPENWTYLQAFGRDGRVAGSVVIDESGVHFDAVAGTNSPVILSSADYSDAAPNAIAAEDAAQKVYIHPGSFPTGGTYTLNSTVVGDIGPIDFDDDIAAVQAAFDAEYGASEVVISGSNALEFTATFSGATVDDQRIELLTVSDDSLTGDTPLFSPANFIRPNPWGKALGLTAAPGSLYMRNNAGTGQLWCKTSTSDTGWTQVI